MDTLTSRTPYMPQAQIDWMSNYLNRNMRVLEWGSGGSTLFIAPRVKSLVSIEYSKQWYTKVLWHLIKNISLNTTLKLLVPDRLFEPEYASSDKYAHLSFKTYVEIVDAYPDGYFDFILIDGRCRAQCLRHSRTKIKKGGCILLDDADRPHYEDAINTMKNFSMHSVDRSLIFERLE